MRTTSRLAASPANRTKLAFIYPDTAEKERQLEGGGQLAFFRRDAAEKERQFEEGQDRAFLPPVVAARNRRHGGVTKPAFRFWRSRRLEVRHERQFEGRPVTGGMVR